MSLTLSVLGSGDMPQALQVEPKKFSCNGGTIGRGNGDDWVLPDSQRYVSSHHALIEYDDGDYFLIDTSTNGVFLNDDDDALGRNNRVKLSSNDRIYIGEYEILAMLASDAAAGDETFSSMDVTTDMGSIPNNLDPLDLFSGNAVEAVPTPERVNQNESLSSELMDHTPSLSENFIPPAVERENQLPDDWALTQMPAQPLSADSQLVEPHADGGSQIPSDWDQTSIVKKVPPPAPVRKKAVIRQAPVNEGLAREDKVKPPERPRPGGAVASKKRRISQPNPSQDKSISPAPVSSDEYIKLLKTIGLNPSAIPPELARVLPEVIGLMVRQCVSGMIDVLMARTNMKSAFRVDQTMIRPVENNPLKFSVGVDEAIENMLLKNGRGYLPALEAIKEGFDDIKAHQMATMAGMQGALQDVLQRFDPEALEQRFAVGSKDNRLLAAYNKTKYWDHYKILYDDIAKEALDNFQNLLGDGFMRAYEEQVRKMENVEPDSKQRKSRDKRL